MYHTHQMVLGYVNGPTEGLLAVTFLYFYLALTGEEGELSMQMPIAPVRFCTVVMCCWSVSFLLLWLLL
jgi:hypothetical protein